MQFARNNENGILESPTIQAFESHRGVFPADYRDFLLKHNGCYPDPEQEVRVSRNGTTEFYGLPHFLGIPAFDSEESLRLHTEFWDQDYGIQTMPIAEDECGNYYLLSLRDDDHGTIYFQDHEQTDLSDWSAGRTAIAPSFTDFLNMLTDTDMAAQPDPEERRRGAYEKILGRDYKGR